MPTVTKPNGFLLFAKELQKSHSGRHRLSLSEATEKAANLWKDLTPNERARWKELAQDARESGVGYPRGRRQTTAPKPRKVSKGIQDELERRRIKDYYGASDEESYERKRAQDLEQLNSFLVFNADPDPDEAIPWLCEQSFVMLGTIPYLKMADQRFLPAEVALLRFKIREGVMDLRHFLLAPDFSVTGVTGARRDDESCGLPDPTPKLETDFARVYKRIWSMVAKDSFIFCLAADYNCVKGCLNWLKSKYLDSRNKDSDVKEPRLVALEELTRVLAHFPAESVVANRAPSADEVQKAVQPSFLTSEEMVNEMGLCQFHANSGEQNCAVRIAKTALWGALMLVAKYHGFDLEPSCVPVGRLQAANRSHSEEQSEAVEWEASFARRRQSTRSQTSEEETSSRHLLSGDLSSSLLGCSPTVEMETPSEIHETAKVVSKKRPPIIPSFLKMRIEKVRAHYNK